MGHRRGMAAAVALLASCLLAGLTVLLIARASSSPGLAQIPPTCAPDAGTTVCVLPPSQITTAGTDFSVDVVIDDVTNLGAYQVTVLFDPAVVSFVGATYGPFLGSTGRVPNCFSPSLSTGGVKLACVTTPPPGQGPPGPDGPNGSGVLVTATFAALAAGTSALELSNVIVTDITGTAIPHLEQDGKVTVLTAPTSTPCDGICPTSTPTPTRTPTPTAGPGPVIVRIDPPSQDQLTGATFSVDVVVEGVSDLGAYEFVLAWDPGVLSFVSVSNGPFLGSTGRPPFCPDTTVGVNTVRFGCVTTGSTPPGLSGSGILSTIVFQAVASSDGLPSTLDLFNVGLSTPLGVSITASVLDGTVTVSDAPTPTPTPCDGVCPTPTVTPTATITPTPTPTPVPVPCAPGVGTRVCVQPAALSIGLGDNFSVDVAVDSVSGLGAYQFTLVFDPNIVAFSSVSNGFFLGSSGRVVFCDSPRLTLNSVRFACVTLGPTPPAPSGSGVLARVTFLAIGAGTSPLDLQNVILADIDGNQIPAADQDGSVTVLIGPTPTPTITPTPGPTFTPTPTAPLPSTATRVSPAAQTVSADANFTVDITVENVTNLGSYEWQLAFDPALAGYVSVVNGPFLGSTGRSVFCPSPILDVGSVRFGCVTTGLLPPPPSGSGVLSTVTFSALAPGTSLLDLVWVSLSDPLANDIPTQIFDGSVTIEPAPTPTATPTPTP